MSHQCINQSFFCAYGKMMFLSIWSRTIAYVTAWGFANNLHVPTSVNWIILWSGPNPWKDWIHCPTRTPASKCWLHVEAMITH